MATSDQAGFVHIHPTLVLTDDGRLFYAWSKVADGRPKVMVEEFTVEF